MVPRCPASSTVPYVRTADNHADFFTKALPTKPFYAMRDQIMNVPVAQRDTPD